MGNHDPWKQLGRAIKASALKRLGLPLLKLYGLLLAIGVVTVVLFVVLYRVGV